MHIISRSDLVIPLVELSVSVDLPFGSFLNPSLQLKKVSTSESNIFEKLLLHIINLLSVESIK